MSDKQDHPTKVLVHEFLIDFLGAMVPGILFLIALAVSLFPIIRAAFHAAALDFNLDGKPDTFGSVSDLLKATVNTPNAIWIGLFIFGILLSYTIGHLFYRREPKGPDAKSFKLLSKKLMPKTEEDWRKEIPDYPPKESFSKFYENYIETYLKHYPEEDPRKRCEECPKQIAEGESKNSLRNTSKASESGMGILSLGPATTSADGEKPPRNLTEAEKDLLEKRCTKEIVWKRRTFGCDSEGSCAFPYPYLDKYLEARGHKHLVSLIDCASKTGDRSNRSKTFINRLKIRLEIHHPEACRSIIRNEAHIRLASSMWYVGDFLWKCSLAAILMFLMLVLPSPFKVDGLGMCVAAWGIKTTAAIIIALVGFSFAANGEQPHQKIFSGWRVVIYKWIRDKLDDDFLWRCMVVVTLIFGFTLVAFVAPGWMEYQPKVKHSWIIAMISPALFITWFSLYCQRAIENFMLYQRLREAFYVLEVAYTRFRDTPHIFDPLTLPELVNKAKTATKEKDNRTYEIVFAPPSAPPPRA